MSNLIPERPIYRKERLLAGFLSLAVFLLLFGSRFLSRTDLGKQPFWGLAVSALALLLPALIFCSVRGRGYTRTLRFRAPRATHLPLLVAVFFALFSGSILLSALFGGTDTFGNTISAYHVFNPETGVVSTAFSALFFSLLPTLLQELIFRGILIAEYERRGAVRAVLVGSLLFAMAHFDLANLPVYFFIGVLTTLTLFATDSLIAVLILQALLNLLFFFSWRYISALYTITGSIELLLFLLVLVLLISLTVFFHACARLYRERAEQKLAPPRRDVPWNVQFYTILDAVLDPPLLLASALAIVGFILL